MANERIATAEHGFAMGRTASQALVAVLALAAIAVALWQLTREAAGVTRTELRVGQTPATLFTAQDAVPGPLVVIAHGFAGSRQFMDPVSYTLAQAGYAALAFDFRGHGRNPVPMSGDVGSVEGTTRLLMDELAAVIAAGQARPEVGAGLALVGHSMATDVLVREAQRRTDVDAIAAISMYSEAVTPEAPARLLIVTGQGEPHLRRFAEGALQSVDPTAHEGESARSGPVLRRAVVAPGVEHVGVLYSATMLSETRAWLDGAFDRQSTGPVVQRGPWIALLLAGIVALAWPLTQALPPTTQAPIPHWRQAAIGLIVPAVVTPLVLLPFETSFLPVLVADYLALHLGVYGLLQCATLAVMGLTPTRGALWPGLLLAFYGIGVFGLALDAYGASFVPHAGRWAIMAAVALGAVPFMVADQTIVAGGHAPIAMRFAARLAVFVSFAIAVALDFEGLFFLILILPVILLFFLLFGTMGGWVGRRSGPLASGLALGLILAWSIGVSFPLFSA